MIVIAEATVCFMGVIQIMVVVEKYANRTFIEDLKEVGNFLEREFWICLSDKDLPV